MKKRIFIVLTISLTCVCVILFKLFYKEAKDTAVTRLNEEELIHAEQAARGIEDFFAISARNLSILARMGEIIDNDSIENNLLKLFYEDNQEQISAITRMDEKGIIKYCFPISGSIGKDISEQKHVLEILSNHKTVTSDVFKSVEGYYAIALHVPVFRSSEFKGSIGILIKFESLAKRYLQVIKIGETGYSWVASRDGTILYSPITGYTGNSVFEIVKDFPSLSGMVNDMLKGHRGSAEYTFDRIGDQKIGNMTKYAVYIPVKIGNTFWSIVVAAADKDVFAGLISFRNKLFLVIIAIFICGMVFSILATKAWLIVKEEEKRRKVEEELRIQKAELEYRVFERTAQLETVNKELEAFSHSVSHDLRSPLRHLKGFADLLQKNFQKLAPEDIQSHLDTISSSANKMGILINDLLSFSRTSHVQLKKTTVKMNQLLKDALSQIRLSNADRQIDWRISSLPDVSGDNNLLRQVWINLLDNAVKYTRKKEKAIIEVGYKEETKEIIFFIKDNGVGFDKLYSEKLFGVFQRLHSSSEFEGTGIGLANVRRIISRHGGKTWAEAELEMGASFYFSLPKL
ncbi:MAG: ATP-binding protein [Bacteroidales bacterium]